jgi:glutaminyl-tRNA synthetase
MKVRYCTSIPLFEEITQFNIMRRKDEINLRIFEDMKLGKYNEGDCVLRAKIDMSSPNMHLRDPLMYRILKQPHHRTGDKWCIYPMYDYAHGQSDFWEGITHSICTLEFEVHRPLYEWFVDELQDTDYRPRQIEFSRLNITSTVMSKRKLLQLVKEGYVKDWDDPRMPTICGLRRRGYTPESIRNFADMVGITKVDGVTDVALLEFCIREDLNKKAQRLMCVTDPLKIVLTNYPEDTVEEVDAINNPEDESMGKRKVPFSKELYIEQEDFMEEPSSKFYRLAPGKEVRLRYAYFIRCNEVIKDSEGNIVELQCTYDPETKGGNAPDGRKVKATLHWVSSKEAVNCEVRLYDRLFTDPDPDGHKEKDFLEFLNPESLKTLGNCYVEPFIKDAKPLTNYQFERLGYFNVDPDSRTEKLVFNRTVSLKDNSKK